MKDTLRQATNGVAVLAVIVVNALANILPFNGLTTGEISDRFRVFFVPAGYVFSIWGLIYLGLVGFAVYQALPAQRTDPALRRVGYLFAWSALANIAWLFFWHYEQFVLTLPAMLSLLLLLIAIYLRLDIGRARVGQGHRWLVHLPFRIYLGWITVATIANVTSLLDYLKWGMWGIRPEAWTVIMLLAAVAIAVGMTVTRRDAAFLLVLVWAFVGIGIQHAGQPVVAPAAWISAGLVAVLAIAAVTLARRPSKAIPAP
jgi:benzodiazapine receptor